MPILASRLSRLQLEMFGTVLAALLAVPAPSRAGDGLSSPAFQLQYGPRGVTSLKATGDTIDTDYIAPNGALGPLIVKYRTTPNGDWRELRDLVMTEASPARHRVTYGLGTRLPALATLASGSAVTGAAGIRALNDGLVPAPPGGGRGRGGGPGGPSAQDVPVFSWSGARGITQWVQYTFPADESLSRVDLFWTEPPQSWRLLYSAGGEWKPVIAHGPAGTQAYAFNRLDFDAVKTMALRVEVTMAPSQTVALAEWRVGDDPALATPNDLHVTETLTLEGDALHWTIALENPTDHPVEIGDLAVPLNLAERAGARADIYTHKLLRHSLVAGDGSWVYWERSNAIGPYLVMAPDTGTRFEYEDNSGGAFTPYIHAAAAVTAATAAGGSWRLPVTALRLAAKGRPGDGATYAFTLRWAKDATAVRDVLVAQGAFDTAIAPGMVVPSDLAAMVSLRSRHPDARLESEFPSATRIEPAAGKPGVYRITFSHLGENLLMVRYGRGAWTSLEFFVTEPLETVIHKRAAFLVSHQQHTDTSKWYAGAFGDWDEKNEILRNPEDRDGLSTWLTDADDDAGNARPAFVASKNVVFPDQREIDAVEFYIKHYLWGGMQRTDTETYPYGLYGIPNWKANRSSPDTGRNGQAHLWRIYDYPHIILLYYRMYQIASFYPSRVKYLDAQGYLERAYRTALAYWTVPDQIEHWSADAVGTMNEAFLPELIDALDREGKPEWAATLRRYWEGKVERFINKTPNLYGSEFAFDSTGFESTGAFAHYAATHPMANVTREAAQTFMDFQLSLDMADRGWLEATYYQLGSDYRGTLSYLLSYMSQMGGWSILDYGLHFAKDPTRYLRLGYASSLSSWALVNSGTPASGYGAWFPSPTNDGATGGGFMPEAQGRAWIGKTMRRGAWYYSAEEDVGYCAALRTHATIVADDPVFGELAYGGVLTRSGRRIEVVPRDGLRVRLHVIRGDQRLHLELDHDGFAKERSVTIADDLSRIAFTLENRTGGAHTAGLTIAGLPPGTYDVRLDGAPQGSVPGSAAPAVVALEATGAATNRVTIIRR